MYMYYVCIYIYLYIYIYLCICICLLGSRFNKILLLNISLIYILIYIKKNFLKYYKNQKWKIVIFKIYNSINHVFQNKS